MSTSPIMKFPALSQVCLQCIACESTFDTAQNIYTCEKCGDLLDVSYDWNSRLVSDYRKLFDARRASANPLDISGVWRFRELLPFYTAESQIVTMFEGNTAL
ncbi:MAG TPA: threonine synthase, partial [Acidobacteriota bacterium]|nr:threonine synthase [Acidobacteriota bacterium]